MATLFWSIFILAVGGCIGSFLNVVIYRWPIGLSVRKPIRSFCPICQHGIAWYDNIPVLSYLRLRGRCRNCGVPISLQYPIVESVTALVFLMTYDAFFVSRLRLGVSDLFTDAPILIAHWALFAGLIVLTVMDMEAYMVDIRVTWLVSLVGIVGHALWTPFRSYEWIRPGTVQAGWAMAVTLGLIIGALLMLRRGHAEPMQEEPPPEEPPEGEPGATSDASAEPASSVATRSRRWLWLIVPIGLIVGYAATMVLRAWPTDPLSGSTLWFRYDEPDAAGQIVGAWRLRAGLLVLFLTLTIAASEPRAEADAEIVDAIEFEAADARRMALQELLLITPALILGVAALWILTHSEGGKEAFGSALTWRAWGDWRPVWGLSTGLAGWVIGGAVGWLARIGFTLLFGKEALGMGDVHILAAAGAVAGWPVAVFGFFIGAVLALLGLVVISLRRQGRMLPYGPWLGLGFFLAAMFQDQIFEYLNIRWLFENG